jgi:tetratricopeptide (TPR) repeat protein
MLNEYLKIFMADLEAWQELAELYIDSGLLKNASFCYEELLLAMPTNLSYLLKYGQLQYSMEQFKVARKYFARCVELSQPKTNFPAMYGLYMSSLRTKGSEEVADDICLWSFQQLLKEYKQSSVPPHLGKLLTCFEK